VVRERPGVKGGLLANKAVMLFWQARQVSRRCSRRPSTYVTVVVHGHPAAVEADSVALVRAWRKGLLPPRHGVEEHERVCGPRLCLHRSSPPLYGDLQIWSAMNRLCCCAVANNTACTPPVR